MHALLVFAHLSTDAADALGKVSIATILVLVVMAIVRWMVIKATPGVIRVVCYTVNTTLLLLLLQTYCRLSTSERLSDQLTVIGDLWRNQLW